MAAMREVCRDCDAFWAVSMTPRESVLCASCASPRPWRNPVRYWQGRLWNQRRAAGYARSPEWWDEQTTREDLRVALVAVVA